MSQLRTARQLAEDALRRIGAYAINDSAARPQDLDVALNALDKLVAELSGTVECFWLRPAVLSVPLTADTQSYDLRTVLSTNWPSQGIEYVRDAWIENSTSRFPIELVTKLKFDHRYVLDQSGQPEIVNIDRLIPSPTLRVWPVPSDGSWTLKLDVQTQAPDIWTQRPAGKSNAGVAVLAGIPASWNRWAEYELAADIGSGPVRKLPDATTNNWRVIAGQSRAKLEAVQNREHETTPPVIGSMEDFTAWDWGNPTRDAYDPGKP